MFFLYRHICLIVAFTLRSTATFIYKKTGYDTPPWLLHPALVSHVVECYKRVWVSQPPRITCTGCDKYTWGAPWASVSSWFSHVGVLFLMRVAVVSSRKSDINGGHLCLFIMLLVSAVSWRAEKTRKHIYTSKISLFKSMKKYTVPLLSAKRRDGKIKKSVWLR